MGMESPDNRSYELMTPTERFCAGRRCCQNLRKRNPSDRSAIAIVMDAACTLTVTSTQLAKPA
jgi:hypothetical protein